jgi:hypothetical protein
MVLTKNTDIMQVNSVSQADGERERDMEVTNEQQCSRNILFVKCHLNNARMLARDKHTPKEGWLFNSLQEILAHFVGA